MSNKPRWTGLIRNSIFISKTVYRPSETNFISKIIKTNSIMKMNVKIKPDTDQTPQYWYNPTTLG